MSHSGLSFGCLTGEIIAIILTTQMMNIIQKITPPSHSRPQAQESPMTPNPAALYLDDLHVGLRFSTGSHAIDEAQIIAFARAFDPQPFHLDHEAACNSVFGGLAASGWHTAALTMRLLVTEGAPIAGGLIGAGTQLTWPRPTRSEEHTSELQSPLNLVCR